MNGTTLRLMCLMKMLEAERPGVGPCCTMLKETAPTVSIVCNTSKIQVALFRWVVKEGQAHRRSGAACILGIGEIRGANAPSAHAGVFGKGKRITGRISSLFHST